MTQCRFASCSVTSNALGLTVRSPLGRPDISFDFHDVVISTWRWIAGVTLGSGLALVAAILVDHFPRVLSLVRFASGFLRCLPILALVPLVSKTLGIAEYAKVLLIGWACFFPVFLSTIGSVGQRLPDLELRIGIRKFSAGQVWLRYKLPRLLTGFVAGVEISIGIGWLTVVAAETLGTLDYGPFRGGLGDKVFQAINNGDFGLGLICLAMFGILGVITSEVWRRIGRGIVRALGFDPAILAMQ